MGGTNSDLVAFGTIQGGRIRFHDRRGFDDAIRRFRDGAEVEIEVSQRRATRSVQSNRWYWGVIVQLISEHTGYTPDELHDVLKMKFIPKRLAICNDNGEVVDEFVVGGSTRKMNSRDFSEYCENIRRWAAETLDIVIPDPDGNQTQRGAELAGHGWGV